MLQSMGSHRIGHDVATEQLQKGDGEEMPANEAPSNLDCPVTLWMDQELGSSRPSYTHSKPMNPKDGVHSGLKER